MQDDYMKRVRDGGGAREALRAEGIVIFGDYAGDQLLAGALDLPRPGPGGVVSARLVRRRAKHARGPAAPAGWAAPPGAPPPPPPRPSRRPCSPAEPGRPLGCGDDAGQA